MVELGDFIHYGTIALTVGISSFGVGIGSGIVASAALEATDRQPAAANDIAKTAMLGLALIETAVVFGTATALILLYGQPVSTYGYIAELGITFAVCLGNFTIGIVSARPIREACYAVARQPFFSQKIMNFMFITQSMLQTPVIFGLVIALMIKNQAATIVTFEESLKLIASGLCIGLGSIGPAIGLARFAKIACRGIGINREAYNKLFSFTLMSEAMIETPIIFSLVVSLIILMTPLPPAYPFTKSLTLLAAALCIGLGNLGPGISSGKASSAACEQIAFNPDHYEALSLASLVSQGMIDTSAIFALLISLILIYWF